MPGKSNISIDTVVITDSFEGAYVNHLPSFKKKTFNEDLPSGAIGVYCGVAGNIMVVMAGSESTEVIPFINVAAGQVLAIQPRQIYNGDNSLKTTAGEIVILY